MKKLFIILTVAILVTFSSVLLAEDFHFPGISTKEQVRLELWVRGVKSKSPKVQQKQKELGIELEESLRRLEI